MAVAELPSSQELSELAYTVPSNSQHEFLVEAIESHFNAEVAKVQKLARDNITKLEALLEEQKTKKSSLEEVNYLEVAVERKDDEIRAEAELTIKRLKMDRDDALKALLKWEETHDA